MLAGAKNPKGAQALIDFMLSRAVPGRRAREHVRAARCGTGRRCPTAFRGTPSRRPTRSSCRRREIGANRDRWIDEWTQSRPALRRAAPRRRGGRPGGVRRALLRVPARGDPRARAHVERAALSPTALSRRRRGCCGSRPGRRRRRPRSRSSLGLPLAWAIGRFRFRGRSLARALVLVPFVLPTVVVATAFLALLPDGLRARRLGDPRRPRLLQRRRRDAHRRRRVGDDRPVELRRPRPCSAPGRSG